MVSPKTRKESFDHSFALFRDLARAPETRSGQPHQRHHRQRARKRSWQLHEASVCRHQFLRQSLRPFIRVALRRIREYTQLTWVCLVKRPVLSRPHCPAEQPFGVVLGNCCHRGPCSQHHSRLPAHRVNEERHCLSPSECFGVACIWASKVVGFPVCPGPGLLSLDNMCH